MTVDFFSSSWYRVAALKPRLSPRLHVGRHRYRGESWYVLKDPITNRVHRFTPQTYYLLGQMDGQRTLELIWQHGLEQLGDDAPTQDELIQLLGQLHGADVVECDVPPDDAEIFERFGTTMRAKRASLWRNPLFIRIPLWDPDAFLERTQHLVRPLVGPAGVLLWLALVLPALLLAGVHWEPLTRNLADQVLAAGNLLVLALSFPVVKLLHELGHAYATKLRGGQVHEIGLMLLVLMPAPYVDSSAASAFKHKWSRAVVGAAGMLVETALASLAMFAWVLLEPGFARALCFNVMLIAGVSTVIFNLNPLLRYDGYYILCDLIEAPNLAQRSKRYLVEAIDRHLFRVPGAQGMRLARGEAPWLALYQPLSSIYRTFVMLAIALFVASEYFIVGVLLALWTVAQSLLWPLAKGAWHVIGAPELQRRRGPALATSAGLLALCVLLLWGVPAPSRVMAQGVVWLPEDAQLRAQASGFVQRLLLAPGAQVQPGSLVALLDRPEMRAEFEAQSARVDEAQAKWDSAMVNDRVRAELARQELGTEQAVLGRVQSELQALELRALAGGTLIMPAAAELPGRFARKGEILGWLGDDRHRLVRVVVEQADIERVLQRRRAVQVRLSPEPWRVLAATLVREVPAGRDQLPSKALAVEGGGEHLADPSDAQGLKTLQRVFQLDLHLSEPPPFMPLGARAWVRFDLEPEPLGQQAWRALRLLFLTRFDV